MNQPVTHIKPFLILNSRILEFKKDLTCIKQSLVSDMSCDTSRDISNTFKTVYKGFHNAPGDV